MTADHGPANEFRLSRRERADLCALLAPPSPPPLGPHIIIAAFVFILSMWVPMLILTLLPISVPDAVSDALPVWWATIVALAAGTEYVRVVRRWHRDRNHTATLPDNELLDEVLQTRGGVPFGSPAAQAWARFAGKELLHDPDRRAWVLRDRR